MDRDEGIFADLYCSKSFEEHALRKKAEKRYIAIGCISFLVVVAVCLFFVKGV